GLGLRGSVLLVSRFVPENTVGEFFDAVEKIAEQNRVILVGASGYGGPLDHRAKELSDKFDNVTWLGHIRDDARLFSLFQHAGAYFHGHSVGGTNPALVQAMACGAPIVARGTVYNREVLADSALYCSPEAQNISEVVISALKDTAVGSQRGLRARERAIQQYSWSSVCEAYNDLLNQALIQLKQGADVR
ncbi:glycosyltransferase, partial [Microbacterium sp. Bi128]|uniref:glycosyltransferase n=1 Tax=Microbacterium sp. Bi128 TaxID=2821115 RepID=UPI001E383AAC